MPSSHGLEDSLGLIEGWHLEDGLDHDRDLTSDRVSPLVLVPQQQAVTNSIGELAPYNHEVSDFTLNLDADKRDHDATVDQLGSTLLPMTGMTQATSLPEVIDNIVRPVNFPKLDETVGVFHLKSELGRGAFAHVYLAEQINLGKRLVAVKISKAEGDEPEILARLQHTHIVPIHSVNDDPVTGLRLMCMPYFGGANLARILSETGARLPHQMTGCSFIDALDNARCLPTLADRSLPGSAAPEVSQVFASGRLRGVSRSMLGRDSILRPIATIKALWTRLPAPWVGRREDSNLQVVAITSDDRLQPARQFLRKATHVRASAWIIARLAEGLEHAHSRGLLHRDLKPSNILITADGTPMLLDFNLSADVRDEADDDGAKAMLGGTLPYMAPEHLDAFNPQGSTLASEVNERSDIYALGLILFEMVAGRHPFTGPTPGRPMFEMLKVMTEERLRPAPSAREANPDVTWSLDAIIRKSLDPIPAKRYSTAGEFAEDLRRFLADHPNRHAPEPSRKERVEKFLRRNPRIAAAGSVTSLAMVLILLLGSLLWFSTGQQEIVEARLAYKAFQNDFQDCQFLLNTTGGPTDHLRKGLKRSQETLKRFGVSTDGSWRKNRFMEALTREEQASLRTDLGELIMLDARSRVALAIKLGHEEDRRRALEAGVRRLDITEANDGITPAALYVDRARYKAALGMSAEAAADRARAAKVTVKTCRDFYLLGTSLVAQRKPIDAEPLLAKAVSLEPKRFWAWFALGHCRFDQGRFLEAAGDFGTCTVINPDFAWAHLNRGLALAHAGKLQDAMYSYDQALAKSPKFTEALVNRGFARLELHDLERARSDLKEAVDLGRTEPTVLAALASALSQLGWGDRAETMYQELLTRHPNEPNLLVARGLFHLETDPSSAQSDFERVIQKHSRHARAHLGLAMVLRAKEPILALEHANRAYEFDRNLLDALQIRAILKARMGNLSAVEDVDALIQSPTPHRLYNGACALALLAHTNPEAGVAPRAVGLLDRALRQGFSSQQAKGDRDLQSLHDRKDYVDAIERGHP